MKRKYIVPQTDNITLGLKDSVLDPSVIGGSPNTDVGCGNTIQFDDADADIETDNITSHSLWDE